MPTIPSSRTKLLMCGGLAAALWSLPSLPAQEGAALTPSFGVLGPPELHHGPVPEVPGVPRAATDEFPKHDDLPVPYVKGSLPQPNSPPGADAIESVVLAPEDLRFFKNRDAGGSASTCCPEPSAAIARDTAFQTYNTMAAISPDSGHNWTTIDPSTRFPSIDGGFCCDQRTIYDPGRDITIWYLQYRRSTTTNRGSIRIAVAVGRDGLRNNQWHSYVFRPENFNQPAGRWLDFPDIALSSNYLYLASNVFDFAGSNQNSVCWRVSLQTLRDAGSLGYSYFTRTTPGSTNLFGASGSYRYAQGTGATMYIASHVDTSNLRIYRWTESPDSAFFNTRSVPTWLNGTRNATAPNGINWLGAHDRRVQSGYRVSGEYGFMWSCEEDPANGRPWPFVRVARFRTSDHTLINAQDIWNGSYGLGYPGCGTNSLDHKGVVLSTGGPSRHVRSVAFIVDQFLPNFSGQSWGVMNTPTNSPPTARWGDYSTVVRHPVETATFVGTGMYMSSASVAQTRYLWFGRELYEPAWVDLNVQSTPITGVPVTVDVADRFGNRSGNTNFTRSYPRNQGYALTAPATRSVGSDVYAFSRWTGSGGTTTNTTITVSTIGAATDTMTAEYVKANRLTIASSRPSSGVGITVSPADVLSNGSGTTVFNRYYRDGQSVTLTAPATFGGVPFKQWVITGVRTTTNPTVTFSMSGAIDRTATAEYYLRIAGALTPFGGGCRSSTGTVMRQGASGTPEIGQVVNYSLTGGLPNGMSWLIFGFSNTTFNGIPLPFDNAPIGAAGCITYISHDVLLGGGNDSAGARTFALRYNNDRSLIGAHIYTQYYGLDLRANRLGLTMSNAVDTRLGGLQ